MRGLMLLMALGVGAGWGQGTGAVPAAKPVAVAGLKTEATPAMWKVKGVHGTVYLFGTVHVMRPEVHWETAKVKEALKGSDTLYLEIEDVGEAAMQKMQPLIMEIGVDAAHPLSTKISKEDVALLDAAAKSLGAPGADAFEPMKPWLVDATLEMLPAMKAGFDPKMGVDATLQAEAKAQGKPIKGFETAEGQMKVLAGFTDAEQVAMLHDTLVDMPKAADKLNEMLADWTTGDVEKIAALDDADMRVKHPAMYEKVLVKRNVGFADAIGGLLKDPATGTVFAAVGAGHLAGPDSVIKDIEKMGYKVERVE